ncbi:LysR family transcriptional regulator [Streptomyces sp. HU2014]|uniref:LysR family transcriptional regulator n=1 Tax=Streptomyces albireticuli TaxID=1940 RepID=A0A1Z2KWT7_9ACTN|nr:MULTISPECIES: LysR family transcriptional regulator [Streptomyces]ARZ66513.1 LysR family transcriptional regulator [Streptomyces albireticuli]UQI46763.1 LysR family transcriptional regulator [Streptomyces sp. HU2014]
MTSPPLTGDDRARPRRDSPYEPPAPVAEDSVNLSLRQLEYLVVTLGEGRLTRAARRLHVTEPTVSQQLKALERAVGTPLLVRGADGVRPTPAGEALLPHARTALRCARQARSAALAAGGAREAPLRVATLPSLLPGLLPVLRAWSLARPDTGLVVSLSGSRRLLQDGVTSGAADLGAGPRPEGWHGAIRPFGTEEFVVVCPADHPLRGGAAPVRELLDDRWICYREDGRSPLALLAGADEPGPLPRRPFLEVPSAGAAIALAADGAGLTAVPSGAVPPRLRSQVIRPLPGVSREITLFTAPDAPEGTAAHAAELCRHAAPRTAPDEPVGTVHDGVPRRRAPAPAEVPYDGVRPAAARPPRAGDHS